MAREEFERLRQEMQGCWARPLGSQQFVAAVRASGLGADEVAQLLDAVPQVRTGTTGDACRYLAEALERIRSERSAGRGSYQASGRKRIVFISCGQYTESEKELGKQIVRLVKELTPFEPYFAENVNDLEGLTRAIFAKLNEAAGFICVMHHRGAVTTPAGTVIRASVWIEQEIGIAAFLRQTLGRDLPVAAFAQRGIHLEGVRAQLLLNPTVFENEAEVLEQLPSLLKEWASSFGPSVSPPAFLLRPEFQVHHEGGTHSARYRVSVALRNCGTAPINDFRAEISVPRGLVPDQTGLADEDARLSTTAHRVVVRNQQRFSSELPLHRERDLTVFALDYTINEATWLQRQPLSSRSLTVTVHAGDMEPQVRSLTVEELGLAAYQPAPIEVGDPTCNGNSRVKAFVDASASAGQLVKWKYESEIVEARADGHPYVFLDGRRVFTHGNRNKGNRSLPPEYLVYNS